MFTQKKIKIKIQVYISFFFFFTSIHIKSMISYIDNGPIMFTNTLLYLSLT